MEVAPQAVALGHEVVVLETATLGAAEAAISRLSLESDL